MTKLNHSDQEGVHRVYGIYDMTRNETYSPADLKQAILNQRGQEETHQKSDEIQDANKEIVEEKIEESVIEESKEDMFQEIEKHVWNFIKRLREKLLVKKGNREDLPVVVYPEDEEPEKEVSVNPTICLAATLGEARGMLIYEGMGDYPDFELGQDTCILGKNPRLKLYINRETISQFHAKFDYGEKNYYIEDMNSTNGTFVNDQMLNYKEKRILSPGDVLRFADVKYRFL